MHTTLLRKTTNNTTHLQMSVKSILEDANYFFWTTALAKLVFCDAPPSGPLRSMVEQIQSEESDDDDSSSEEETPIKTNPPNRDSRSVPT